MQKPEREQAAGQTSWEVRKIPKWTLERQKARRKKYKRGYEYTTRRGGLRKRVKPKPRRPHPGPQTRRRITHMKGKNDEGGKTACTKGTKTGSSGPPFTWKKMESHSTDHVVQKEKVARIKNRL